MKMKAYNFKASEAKWQRVWAAKKTYEPKLQAAKKPFYNLMMFPYPSAEGLHVGNMYAFTGTDIYGRFKRMQGYDVFEPIGLDGFGIHSENYALKIGAHPMKQAVTSEKRFYKQLQAIGNGFAWNERLETYDPDYYRWTQWVFAQMFRAGLAYRKKQAVNWCPSCKTVLADEQVINGLCERCSTAVIQRELEQWFFRITKYAPRLLKNLDKLDWSEKIKIAQSHWIGKSEGALINFKLRAVSGQKDDQHEVQVFTTRPDTLFGATFIAISPELATKWLGVGWQASDEVKSYIKQVLAGREKNKKEENPEKTGINTFLRAVNPANGEELPVWVVNYVLGGVGTGAIMGVPAHDERDFDFAKKYQLPIRVVVSGSNGNRHPETSADLHTGAGLLIDSGNFTGLDSEKAKWEIVKLVKGKREEQFRLRDWLISRQRYWGAPIPMIYCAECAIHKRGERKDMPGWFTVPDKDLPVKLPFLKNFRPTGTDQSPLSVSEAFYKVRCPKCKAWAKRETDVSDTFLDSAWYYLRYPSVTYKKSAWDPKITKRWTPVDMYIGGAEHAVLHLLYVRFVAMVLKDLRLTSFEEPFKKFRAHGLLIKDGMKMSKSKGNVVNPDEYIKKFGADTLRTYLMFLAPFEYGGDFRDQGVLGVKRFLERAWKFNASLDPNIQKADPKALRILHQTIAKVTKDLESLQYNTAVSALMILLNSFEENPKGVTVSLWKDFLKMLAPFAPHITEEMWQVHQGGKKTFQSIHAAPWPKSESKFAKEDTITLVVQVNGKVRDSFEVPAGISESEAQELAVSREKIKSVLQGASPKRVIYIPGRLINIVV